MSQPNRGRNSQAKNHLITIVLALIIAGLATWLGYGRDHVSADPNATAAPGVTATVTATPMPGDGLTVTYLDVGQGDCTLLQCDGQVMLIDAAEGDQANKITAYLKQQGVTAIDYLVCTHAHADHCGGMKAVIAHSFARIFYRNAFNMGLLLLEIGDDVNKIKDGDKLEVSPEEGVIKNLTTGETIKVPALSPVMQNLIDKGGLVNYVREEIEAEGK